MAVTWPLGRLPQPYYEAHRFQGDEAERVIAALRNVSRVEAAGQVARAWWAPALDLPRWPLRERRKEPSEPSRDRQEAPQK